jgi:hypothetical protein
VELVPPGQVLAKLPDQNPPSNPRNAPDPRRPERNLAASNVTNYLDPAAYSPDFEYWVTAWSDSPGTIHEMSAIDESVAELTKLKFLCQASQRVTRDASGTKGTAPGQLSGTERFVIECVGNCKDVFYRPYVGANVTHFGLTERLAPASQPAATRVSGPSLDLNQRYRTDMARLGQARTKPIQVLRSHPGAADLRNANNQLSSELNMVGATMRSRDPGSEQKSLQDLENTLTFIENYPAN